MAPLELNDAVFQFMEKMTGELVSESGDPLDRFHLGKLVLKALRENPEAVNQIDGGTGESETNSSVLFRSARLASCFRKYGLRTGDAVAIMSPSHLDMCIPFFAALYTGAIVMAVDRTLAVKELVSSFDVGRPSIVFCESSKAEHVQQALNQLELSCLVVTFDAADFLSTNMTQFLQQYADEHFDVDTFEATSLDGRSAIAFIIATSGTTGLPKAASVTHKNFCITSPYLWCRYSQFPRPTSTAMVCAPLQWLTAIVTTLTGAIFTFTRLQSSLPMTPQHCCQLIKKYRPTWTVLSPTMMTTLLNSPESEDCDFSCFELILLGGSAVSPELVERLKAVSSAAVSNVFGMSELAGLGFTHDASTPIASSGRPVGCLQYRLMNVETGEEIFEPYVPGELWVCGHGIFVGYYNNEEATRETFAEGRWFKTGDLFYRDFAHYYYYVDRIKLMLKYKSYQISPVELENLIRSDPRVADVAVTGVPDPECGDLAVACVVRREGSGLTAQDVKDLVKENLSDAKQLRGGVLFLDKLPLTASTKVHRRKLKELASAMPRE